MERTQIRLIGFGRQTKVVVVGNAVGKQSGQGKRFLRMYGTSIDVHGEFELRGQEFFNHGKPFTVNSGGTNGETYEFLKQKLSIDSSSSRTTLIGLSLNFVFQPDNNHSTTFLTSSNFKLWKMV